MADPEQLKRLAQGVGKWNAWRSKNRDVSLDLSNADLHDLSLRGINLSLANLRESNLYWVNLNNADLHESDFSGANLSGATFYGADLSGASLHRANLDGADLRHADLHDAIVGETVFARVDLCEVKGLVEIKHTGPSRVELHTILLPQDGSALHFLRGTGVPDEWIDFWRTTRMHPIEYRSCFISYSSKDEILAHRLYNDLQAQGVRCWFAPKDLKIGDKFRQRIDEAIYLQDKLLLLLSKHSIESIWVASEVEAALEKEDRQQREVLFPVRLDDTVKETSQAWAATLRRTRHIGDFTNWTDPQAYQSAIARLLHDLKPH